MRLRKSVIARREKAIEERHIGEPLEDQPGDYWKRACKRCGAEVVAILLRPVKAGGAGGELIRCRCGHWLDSDGWRVVRND